MIDKQIMIDGVNVAGCVRLQDDEISCDLGGECKGWENCYFKQLARKTQECEKLSILAQEESARNAYIEYELNDKLKQKTQELYFARNEIHSKTEYIQEQRDIIDQLKQECEELKEKNKVLQKLVSELEYSVQTGIELNARYCKALKEIETELSLGFTTTSFYKILNIISKAKGDEK